MEKVITQKKSNPAFNAIILLANLDELRKQARQKIA